VLSGSMPTASTTSSTSATRARHHGRLGEGHGSGGRGREPGVARTPGGPGGHLGHARSPAAGGPGPGPGSGMRPLAWRTGCSLQVVHERSDCDPVRGASEL
jgi:hypothetical protein